jgi:hypothetical protein
VLADSAQRVTLEIGLVDAAEARLPGIVPYVTGMPPDRGPSSRRRQ